MLTKHYLKLCALQHLFNKVLYQNASKRSIQHIRPLAQSAHATICSAIMQPLADNKQTNLIFRGNADKIRFRIWIQFGGMTSQNP
jgi:hypothetical protein